MRNQGPLPPLKLGLIAIVQSLTVRREKVLSLVMSGLPMPLRSR